MKTIDINTSSKKYKIHIGKGLLSRCGELVKQLGFDGKVIIVTDDTVADLYLDAVKKSFENAGYKTYSHIFPHGEENKNLNTVIDIYSAMQKCGIKRKDLLVALGGGVTGDISGFAAATYLRGIKYVQIPTTLLAQVDSSIGGKTGVDLPFGKNLVGAFHQPEKVIIDTDTLKSLPEIQISCGMAEVIKSAFIRDDAFIEFIENSADFRNDAEEFVIRSINIKKEVVEADEFEKYERMMLNFGHTFGHAIEKLMNFKGITHGQAVAIGMCMIVRDQSVKKRLVSILEKYGLGTETDIPADKIIEASQNDKKAEGNSVNIVTLKKAGEAEIVKLSFEEIKKIYGENHN